MRFRRGAAGGKSWKGLGLSVSPGSGLVSCAGRARRGRRSQNHEGEALRDDQLNCHKPLEQLRDHRHQVGMLSEVLGSKNI